MKMIRAELRVTRRLGEPMFSDRTVERSESTRVGSSSSPIAAKPRNAQGPFATQLGNRTLRTTLNHELTSGPGHPQSHTR
ncbi:hypothetical protein J6590_058722 [Homalodisca vitripennis]|nr:hypothetical protein J6590_058722 [Homalodisca vitripennis]